MGKKQSQAPPAEVAKDPPSDVLDTPKAKPNHAEGLKVFVGGLPIDSSRKQVKKDLAEIGTIADFCVPVDCEGKSRGVAFVTFTAKEAAKEAVKLDGKKYEGKPLCISVVGERKNGETGKGKGKESDKGKGKGKDGKGKDGKGKDGKGKKGCEGKGADAKTLFISGLPWSVEEDALKEEFSKCGEVDKFVFPRFDQGKPKGIAFVTFKTSEAVEKALARNGTEYGGRTMGVRVQGDAKAKGKGKESRHEEKRTMDEEPEDKVSAKDVGAVVQFAGVKRTFEDSDDDEPVREEKKRKKTA